MPWLSKLFLYWVNPLIVKGRKGKLESADDVFDLPLLTSAPGKPYFLHRLQWGSEIQPFQNWDRLMAGFQMVRFSNGCASAMATVMIPTIQHLDVCVRISNACHSVLPVLQVPWGLQSEYTPVCRKELNNASE